MLKTWITIGSLAGMLSLTSLGNAQALPTAAAKGVLQVGAAWSFVRPDYGTKTIQGVTLFGDFDFRPHLGVEAEYHYISLVTPTDLGEDTVLAGPRFVLTRHRLSYYAKALFGSGNLNIQETQDNLGALPGSFFTYAVGAGIDYRVNKYLVARADFEYQHWSYLTGLTPAVITFGVAYRFR